MRQIRAAYWGTWVVMFVLSLVFYKQFHRFVWRDLAAVAGVCLILAPLVVGLGLGGLFEWWQRRRR